MSNLSVLERLENELAKYDAGQTSRQQFVRFLFSSIEALEGMPYQVLIELRSHERAIEMEGYFDEEGFEANQTDAREALRSWISSLKQHVAGTI
jgi:hypothetical protein